MDVQNKWENEEMAETPKVGNKKWTILLCKKMNISHSTTLTASTSFVTRQGRMGSQERGGKVVFCPKSSHICKAASGELEGN